MSKTKRSYILIITILFISLLSLVLGFITGYIFINTSPQSSSTEYKNQYPLLSERIQLENPYDTIISFKNLRNELNNYVNDQDKKINLYFEYLPTGTSIGINEDEELFGGSLSKIAFVMHAYKLAEQNKINLEDSVNIKPEYLDDRWGNLYYGGANRQIKIKDLAYETIVNSDNTALNTLTYEVNKTYPEELFRELGILHPKISEFDIGIETSPKEYVKILKSLFFSSYLSYESSSEVLELMSKIKDGEGLRADIPENVKIAHKIGFNIDDNDSELSMISDCGIIYVPNRPYILCMMIQDDKEGAQKSMNNISNMIYDHISDK